MTDGYARAVAFQRETVAAIADEITPIPEGWLVRSASLPLVWSVNHVRITQPIEFDAALALAEGHLAGLPYRHLVVNEAAGAEQLADRFRAVGWEVERELTMVLGGEPDRRADTSLVSEPSGADMLAFYAGWIAEDPTESEEAQGQLVEFSRRTWRARNARHLGVVGDSGRLAAMTVLFSDGVIAQVEDVYTLPEQRNRGFARALVTRAVELAQAADHELTFIVADDDGWPKQLYARIGFAPAGREWLFTRRHPRA